MLQVVVEAAGPAARGNRPCGTGAGTAREFETQFGFVLVFVKVMKTPPVVAVVDVAVAVRVITVPTRAVMGLTVSVIDDAPKADPVEKHNSANALMYCDLIGKSPLAVTICY